MTAKTALYKLKSDTQNFLRNNLVVCAGGAVSAQRPFNFGHHGAYIAPRAGVNEVFTFTTIPLNDSEKPVCDNVRMIKNSEALNLASIETYVLTAGCELMITGQLSGCAFCVLQQGNTLTVAHIQPGGLRNMDGTQLKAALVNAGRFNGIAAPLTAVYGRGDYNSHAYVIGVCRSGNWELWGQSVSGPGEGASILNVTQIV